MTYKQKLLDPRWQKKRLEILNRDNFSCKFCGDNTDTLHIHHIAYSDGEPWEIDDSLLITLCKHCHQAETENIKDEAQSLIREMKELGMTSHSMFDFRMFLHYTKDNIDWTKPTTLIWILINAINDKKIFDYIYKKYEINRKKEAREYEKRKKSKEFLFNDLPF